MSPDLRVRTKSGAEYLIKKREDGHTYVKRTGPHSPGINYDAYPDDAWHPITAYYMPEEPDGEERATFALSDGLRMTTPVVSIEPLGDD